jgi:low temperature requirement protein LtrA
VTGEQPHPWERAESSGEGQKGGLKRSALVELFFDLVFVFALTQLSSALVEHLNWYGSLQILLLTLAIWWVWSVTAWAADLYEPRRLGFQLLVIGIMFGVLIMATQVPEAFGHRGPAFACAYIASQTGRTGVLLVALRGHPRQRRPARVLFWFGVSAIPWIAGAIVGGWVRLLLWAVAVTVEYTSASLRWPTPWLGRSPGSDWNPAAEHLSERYRQILIVALGDTILSMGAAFSTASQGAGHIVALMISFLTTVLLWRIYSYQAGAWMAMSFKAQPDRPRRTGAHVARQLDWSHLVMICGIVGTAVGNDLAILHPFEHPRWSWVAFMVGGPTVFLCGRAVLGYVVFGYLAGPRMVGLTVLAITTPAMILLPPVFVAVTTMFVLLGVVAPEMPVVSGILKVKQPNPEAMDV